MGKNTTKSAKSPFRGTEKRDYGQRPAAKIVYLCNNNHTRRGMRQVIGIGEIVLDIIFRGGQPTAAVPGGSTFNSLISLGRAGVPTLMLSETGDDTVGKRCREFMEQNGVNSRYVLKYEGVQSPISLAMLNESSDAQYEFYKEPYGERREFSLPDICPDDVVLFGSYYALNPELRPYVLKFLRYAKQRGALLYYDINFRNAHAAERARLIPALVENMETADVVRGSAEDFENLFAISDADSVYRRHIAAHAPVFIETDGAKQVALRTPSFSKNYAVKPCRPKSTIGAGDNFNAGFIFGLLRDKIGHEALSTLGEDAWDALLDTAAAFALNVCGSMNNYIDEHFARQIRQERTV